MKIRYHAGITRRALAESVSPRALDVIVRANVRQDGLRYQLGHDHFHFDSNRFDDAHAYIENQRARVADSLARRDVPSAWQAFGRLIHAAQDFYAHSNYIPLWLSRFDGQTPPAPPEVDPVSPDILHSPDLRSGKLYYPFEALTFLPGIGKLLVPFLPPDSHAHMNHDSPDNSPLWEYIFHASVKRTRLEFKKNTAQFSPELLAQFLDR
jgi:hypothetical protein